MQRYSDSDGFGWVRLWSRGPGIVWKPRNARAFFSERMGYQRWFRIGRWRVSLLKWSNE
jgi:hypothetical protein